MSELVLQEPSYELADTDAIDLMAAEREQTVIPSSARGKELLPGCKYHDVFDFHGTSIQAVLMTADKE